MGPGDGQQGSFTNGQSLHNSDPMRRTGHQTGPKLSILSVKTLSENTDLRQQLYNSISKQQQMLEGGPNSSGTATTQHITAEVDASRLRDPVLFWFGWMVCSSRVTVLLSQA